MLKCNLTVSYCVVLEYLVLVHYFVWRVIKGGAFVCMTYLFFACIILYDGSSKEESSYLSSVACSFLYYPVWYLIRRGFISISYLFTSYYPVWWFIRGGGLVSICITYLLTSVLSYIMVYQKCYHHFLLVLPPRDRKSVV